MLMKIDSTDKDGESSNAVEVREARQKIWKLNISSKVKHFLWRACSATLPTKHNLYKRQIIDHPSCVFNGDNAETTSHILWECPYDNGVWSLMGGRLQKCQILRDVFSSLVRCPLSMLQVEEFTRWAIMAWSLWNARNKFIYEGMQASPEHIVERGASILRKFQSLLVRVGSSSSLIIPTTN